MKKLLFLIPLALIWGFAYLIQFLSSESWWTPPACITAGILWGVSAFFAIVANERP